MPKITKKQNKEKKPKEQKITKTRALNEYHLTIKDIEPLNYDVVDNPLYRSSNSMILYKLADIEELFMSKYDCEKESIDDKKCELEDKKNEKRENKQNETNEKYNMMINDPNIIDKLSEKIKLTKIDRKVLLVKKLGEAGLGLRSDSKLCGGYIDGTIHTNVDVVVERMCQLHYFYNYCDHKKYFKKAKKEFEKLFGDEYPHGFSLLDQAEECLLKDIGEYPEVYPWLE